MYAINHDQEEFFEGVDTAIDIEAVGNLTMRLAQLLAEEVDLLENMKVKDIAPLQEEKLRLVHALERQRAILDHHPELMNGMTEEQREYLAQIIGIFDQVLRENHRRLRVARDVNLAIVGAIQDAIQEHSNRGVYSVRGTAMHDTTPVSLSLNNIV